MDPTPRWVPGDARSRPAGRGRAPGGLSAPALAIQGARSRVPALGSPIPARPDSGTSSARPLASRPLPRHPFPGAPLPTPLSHLRCSTSRKHLRNRPAQEAPPLSPDPPPLRSAQDAATFPPPYGESDSRIPCGWPLTSGPVLRCLRLRRALTSDSRCVRRPRKPRELPPPRLLGPAPELDTPPSLPASPSGWALQRGAGGEGCAEPALLLAGVS